MSYNIATLNPAVSDWVAFTPTGSWTTNVTYTGFWRRNGDKLECKIKVFCSGAPDNTGLILNLPSGMIIDTSKIFNSAKPITLGTALLSDNAVADYEGYVLWYSSLATPASTVTIRAGTSSGTYTDASAAELSATVPMTWAVNDCISCEFSMPIVGWSSNIQTVQASTEYASNSGLADAPDTTSFAYGPAGSQLQNASLSDSVVRRVRFLTAIQPTDVIMLTVNEGSTNGSLWRPVFSEIVLSGYQYLAEYNNTAKTGIGSIRAVSGSTTDVDIIVGRYVTGTTNWGANGFKWRLEKRSGLAAGEVPPTVYAYYCSATTSSVANSVILQWNTKVEDTHNAVTTGAAWKFTAPVAGLYDVVCQLETADAALVPGDVVQFNIFQNTTAATTFGSCECADGTAPLIAAGSAKIRLAAGDYIQVKASTAKTGLTMYNNDARWNWVQITRIGG